MSTDLDITLSLALQIAHSERHKSVRDGSNMREQKKIG